MTNERTFKKFVSSLMNVLLVLGVLVVQFPLSTPPVKADTLWYDNWTISSGQVITLDDDIIIINGSLTIEGSLTLDNCILYMRLKSPADPGELIDVDGGTFKVLNNSLITTHPTSPDPYEFKIYGTALIENSTVEKMKDISSTYADGIQIYSDDVKIENSTIRLGYGTGVWAENADIPIINSTIIDNNHTGIYIKYGNTSIIDSNIKNNGYHGIYAYQIADYHMANNNDIEGNGWNRVPLADCDGIRIVQSNNITITNNSISNHNYGFGIMIRQSSDNIIDNNSISNIKHVGIYNYYSNRNIITNNSISNNPGGIMSFFSSYITVYNNTIFQNNYGIAHWSSHYHKIVNNLIKDNNRWGIDLYRSKNNIISNNNVSSNNWDNIRVKTVSKNNLISNNTISNSNAYGIKVEDLSSNNHIDNNTIFSNKHRGVILYSSCNNNNISNNNIFLNEKEGILVKSSSNNIINNKISFNNWAGINFTSSDYNNVIDNDISNNFKGICLWSSSDNNTLFGNLISENSDIGIKIDDSCNDNLIYHNHFIDNSNQAVDNTNNGNLWDNGYPSGGNYWSDFDEPSEGAYDNFHGPDQDVLGSDGIVDRGLPSGGKNPYVIDADSKDTYPLIDIWLSRVHNIDKDLWYPTIQEAIDDADPGDTLEAMDGTYNENVDVYKTVTIIGKYGAENTIIDGGGSGDVVDVTADWVNITGFTITNSGSNWDDVGIEIDNVNNCYIAENNVSNNNWGINVTQSSNVIIENNIIVYNERGVRSFQTSPIIRYNTVSYNDHEAIINYYFSNAIIGNNTITHNGLGISMDIHSNGTIDNNTVSYNVLGVFCGSSSPTITYNNITFNDAGIECAQLSEAGDPPIHWGSSDPAIHLNNIHDNSLFNLFNADKTIEINAENNWWGSDPPNPSGIWGRVDYIPWKIAPITEAGPG